MEDAAHRERLERARLKNLEYIRKLDEQKAAAEADAFLASVARDFGDEYATGEKSYDDLQRARESGSGSHKRKAASQSAQQKNTSVYVTGLTTYIACRQLEGVCGKIGKVRRIKFYKDERGGLKGDATVTFGSHAAMQKAIERLNHFEIKPGVLITAVAAHFGTKPAAVAAPEPSVSSDDYAEHLASQPEPERLFTPAEAQESSSITAAPPYPSLRAPADEAELQLDLPSKAIVLKHAWDPLAPQDATSFFDELEQDMRSECSKFGAVDHVHIVANGSVLVRFHALESAIKCLQIMNGRWFDGRKIDARFDQSTPEEPEDPDTKLEAFLASVG